MNEKPVKALPAAQINEHFTLPSPPHIKRVIRWYHTNLLAGHLQPFDVEAATKTYQPTGRAVVSHQDPFVEKLPMSKSSAVKSSSSCMNTFSSDPYLTRVSTQEEQVDDTFQTEYYSMGGHSLELQDDTLSSEVTSSPLAQSPLALPIACIASLILVIGVVIMYYETHSSGHGGI